MPLWLTFTGTDEQALDLLANYQAIRVFLKRSLATGSDATSDHAGKHTDNFFVQTMARAVFWPARDASTAGKRVLQGEVKLKKTFKQSVIFPRFSVRVSNFLSCLCGETRSQACCFQLVIGS
jgi:hypothetical protein